MALLDELKNIRNKIMGTGNSGATTVPMGMSKAVKNPYQEKETVPYGTSTKPVPTKISGLMTDSAYKPLGIGTQQPSTKNVPTLQQTKEFLTKPREEIASNKALQWYGKNIDPKVAAFNESAQRPFFAAFDVLTAGAKGTYTETGTGIKVLDALPPVTAYKALKGITKRFSKEGEDYYVGKDVENSLVKMGVNPSLALAAGLGVEIAIPGPGEVKILGKADKLAKLNKLEETLKTASKAPKAGDVGTITAKWREGYNKTSTVKKMLEKEKGKITPQKLVSNFIDESYPVDKIVNEGLKKQGFTPKEIKIGGGAIPVEQDPRLIYSNLRKVRNAVEYEITSTIGPIIDKYKDNLDDINDLLRIERTDELFKFGKKSKQAIADNPLAKAELFNKYGQEGIAELSKDAEEVRKIGKRTLEIMKPYIDPESYAKMTEYTKYAPLTDVEKNIQKLYSTYGDKLGGMSGDVIKGIKSEFVNAIERPLDMMVSQYIRARFFDESQKAVSSMIDLKKMGGSFSDLIVPVRTADAVKAKMDLYGQASELRPIRNFLEETVKRKSKQVRELQRELDKLNKLGVDAYLKTPYEEKLTPKVQKLQEELQTGMFGTTRTGEAIVKETPLKSRDYRSLVQDLVSQYTRNPEGLKVIKNKIKNRNPKLANLMDELQNATETLQLKRDQIKTLTEQAKLLPLTDKEKGYETITRIVDGIEEIYKVPVEYAEFVKARGTESIPLINALTNIADYQRAIYTGVNPDFIAKNPIRDFYTGAESVFTERGARTTWKYITAYMEQLAGMAGIKTPGSVDIAKRWAAAGGTGSTFYENILEYGKTSERMMKGTKVRNPKDAIERISNMMEGLARKARFSAELKSGKTTEEALYRASRATIDFSRMGRAIRAVNAIVPFTNAKIQAVARNVDLLRENPIRWSVFHFMADVVPETITYAINNQFEDYKDIPEYEKYNNMIIMLRDRTPEEKARGDMKHYIRWPKAESQKPISFATNSFLDYANNQADGKQVVTGILDSLVSFVSPFGKGSETISGAIGMMPLPLKVPAEIQFNKQFYSGAPIEPTIAGQKPEDVKKSELYTKGTAEIYKMAAPLLEKINVSPAQAQYMSRTALGGGISKVPELAGEAINMLKTGETPSIKSIPVVGGFYGGYGSAEYDKEQRETAETRKEESTTIVQRSRKAQELVGEIKNDPSLQYLYNKKIEGLQDNKDYIKAGPVEKKRLEDKQWFEIAKDKVKVQDELENIYSAEDKKKTLATLIESETDSAIKEEVVAKLYEQDPEVANYLNKAGKLTDGMKIRIVLTEAKQGNSVPIIEQNLTEIIKYKKEFNSSAANLLETAFNEKIIDGKTMDSLIKKYENKMSIPAKNALIGDQALRVLQKNNASTEEKEKFLKGYLKKIKTQTNQVGADSFDYLVRQYEKGIITKDSIRKILQGESLTKSTKEKYKEFISRSEL